MKITRFKDTNGDTHYGLVNSTLPNRAELIDGDIFADFNKTGRFVDIAKLLPPVDPPNIIAIGLNYRDHADESKMKIPTVPLIFLKATTSIIGPEDPIILPPNASAEVDYEAELVIVIGKRCRDIEPEQTNSYILGYTCGNDVSARDCQFKIDSQWARAKSFDTFCPIGPWIATPDELDPADLSIRSILNGKVMQDSQTSSLIFPVPQLVSFISKQFTILPGTIIMTGTPPGVGFARKPPVFMKPGDQITIDIQGIGQLTNFVK